MRTYPVPPVVILAFRMANCLLPRVTIPRPANYTMFAVSRSLLRIQLTHFSLE